MEMQMSGEIVAHSTENDVREILKRIVRLDSQGSTAKARNLFDEKVSNKTWLYEDLISTANQASMGEAAVLLKRMMEDVEPDSGSDESSSDGENALDQYECPSCRRKYEWGAQCRCSPQ